MFFGKLVDKVGGIDALREDDNDRNIRPGVFENVLNLCRLGGDELGVLEGRRDIVPYGKIDSVRSEAPKNDHLSNRIFTFGFPFTWKLSLLWLRLFRTEPVLPLF